MKIGKLGSSTEYQMCKQLQNLPILEPNIGFPNSKNSGNSINFWNSKTLACQFFNLEISGNLSISQLRKFQKKF